MRNFENSRHSFYAKTCYDIGERDTQWGREQGFRVWPDEWLTPEELLTKEVKPENFCVGKIDGKVACAFILQNSDTEYWKDSCDAVYLHKLCVKREYAHRNMTKSVIEAEKVVRKIYLNAGFKIVDIIDYNNGRSIALYELVV